MDIPFSDIKKMLSKQFRKPESSINMQTRIKQDLGADSLSVLELLLAIEDEYNLVINASDVMHLKTVQDIADYLANMPDSQK